MEHKPVAKSHFVRLRHYPVSVLLGGIASDASPFMADIPPAMFAAGTLAVLVSVIPAGCGIREHTVPPTKILYGFPQPNRTVRGLRLGPSIRRVVGDLYLRHHCCP